MVSDPSFLDGKLLVAMPSMGDPRFERAVIFLCAHSADGAMGLIVNKPTPELSFKDLLKQLDLRTEGADGAVDVFFGGPVEHARGFVLHTADYETSDSTLRVQGRFGMTATIDILCDIAAGTGPQKALLALGYSGWGPGQLEGEIQRNGWLTCDADAAIIFDLPPASKWQAALERNGIDPRLLSSAGGSA